MKTYPMSKRPKDGDFICIFYSDIDPEISANLGKAENDDISGERLIIFEDGDVYSWWELRNDDPKARWCLIKDLHTEVFKKGTEK